MPYRLLEDVAIADAALEAWGSTLEELFISAAEATIAQMVQPPDSIEPSLERSIELRAESVDLLLYHLLQEIIYYKDAERLLLRISAAQVERVGDGFLLTARAQGEPLDPARHELLTDVKAVTLYRLSVEQTAAGWKATVVLDV